MTRFQFMRTLSLATLFLFSCANERETPKQDATPSQKPFWTVVNFAPEVYDPTDIEALIYGQPEEDKPIIRTLLRQLMREALVGVEEADELTKVLHMSWYIHSHFESVSIEPYTLRGALENRESECAGSSTLLQMMVRSLGIPTRSVGFYGVPIQAAHTAVEVFIDGEWRYLDPSFGVFFTTDGLLTGKPISMDTMLAYRYSVAANAFYPLAEGRLGWDERGSKPGTTSELFSKTQVNLIESGNYKLFLDKTKAATPFAVGYEMIATFSADLSDSTSAWVGTEDQSITDIQLHVEENTRNYDTAHLYFAGDYTGTYGPIVSSHHYSVKGLKPGQTVRFRAGLFYGDPEDITLSVRKGTLDNITREESAIEAHITSLRRDLEISVTVKEEKRILFDYLSFKR